MTTRVTAVCQTDNCKFQGKRVRADAGKACCDFCYADLRVIDPLERAAHNQILIDRRKRFKDLGWIPKDAMLKARTQGESNATN